jgi:hypothetical protein
MTRKTPYTTLDLSAAGNATANPGVDSAAQWTEARLAYPLYAALAVQFQLAPLPHASGELPPDKPAREVFDRDLRWLDSIDGKVRAYQIRQLAAEALNASEETLRAFIQRQLKKPDKTDPDRDKIDLLLVQYFALCAPEELYRNEIKLEHVAKVLQPVLIEADSTPLDWCQPLEQILEKLSHCSSLRDLLELGLVEQGRLLKESAGCMFYDPAALVAFCRFNFLVRRAFIRLLHADLNAVRQAVDALDAKGVKTVDCRGAGFSAAETTAQLRFFCENWRQPFQKDYTESSVTRAFEQLLALRADLEEGLSRGRANSFPPVPRKSGSSSVNEGSATPDSNLESLSFMAPSASSAVLPAELSKSREAGELPEEAAVAGASSDVAQPAVPPAEIPAVPTAAAEAEKCLESIWEQLIATPPSRGRSMSTVILQDTKVLLSSWEVAAFVAEGGVEAEDLRRAVVARALLAVATDKRKRSGDERTLASALALARNEVSYFQGRVEQAKRSKNTEAAVNLGISAKRLLSFIDEAEKLHS